MPIPDGIQKITISGIVATGKDIFNTSFYLAPVEGGTFPTDSEFQASIEGGPAEAFLDAMKPLMANGTAVEAVDLYELQDGAAVRHAHASIEKIGTGANIHPPQCSAVITLRTALNTRRGRGRMYLPANGIGLQVDGLMTLAPLQDAVDALAAWFSNERDGDQGPVVVSQTANNYHAITSVDADRVPDIQRRRANKLTSPRYSADVS